MVKPDGLGVLAAGLARRARVDALHVAGSTPVAGVTATQPVAPVVRGNKRKRSAVTPQKAQSSGKCTVRLARIISRGVSRDYQSDAESRLEKQPVFDWSIISTWK